MRRMSVVVAVINGQFFLCKIEEESVSASIYYHVTEATLPTAIIATSTTMTCRLVV